MHWQARPLIMGILNVTPDSFSDGGRYFDPEAALDHALEMEAQGADLIDLGGESSRPGADLISKEVELARVVPVLQRLRDKLRIPISIDTWKADVAEVCLGEGAEIVNDISAGRWDPLLWQVIAKHQAGYVLMHAGHSQTARHEPIIAADPTEEVTDFLRKFLVRAEENGIPALSIVCDPGFGFAKTLTQNLLLLQELDRFVGLRRPISVGLSKKSFLKMVNGVENLGLSTVLANLWASSRGAALWRVHDVATAVVAAKLIAAVQMPPEGM
jgi:dihydropteroate synthase